MSARDFTFEAFNARDLSPDTVAQSFVPSDKYTELTGPSHSILIGPRGSGKTTLLKMLSIDALRAWRHPKADRYRRDITYTGIFVPADITWGEMVDALASSENVPKKCANALGEAAFCINVFIAALDAMTKRVSIAGDPNDASTYRAASIEEDVERLIRFIADTWKLRLLSLSFRGIAQALSARLAELYSLAKSFSHKKQPTMELLYEMIPYASLHVFYSLIAVLKEFNRCIGEPAGRWALLLDEFEVVPVHIQELVIANLRAAPPELRFKVALAPCGPQTEKFISDTAPNAMDDTRRIELWYREKTDVIAFCRILFESRFRNSKYEHFGVQSPEQLLGRTAIGDEGPGADASLFDIRAPTRWGEMHKRAFVSLAQSDESFRVFLADKVIDPTQLDPSPTAANGNIIRKIAPLLAFRLAYRNKTGGLRGRKRFSDPYVGWEAIATISEGNPRWFIGMLVGLERELEVNGKTPLPHAAQWKHVNRTVGAFQEKIKTVAIEDNMGITTERSVFGLLRDIGGALHRELVTADFSEDPPATFVVDDAVSQDMENCLRIALNFGAIVCYDPPDHVAGFRSLRGKQFRLGYILAPAFNLPLRKGKARSLSNLLAPSTVGAAAVSTAVTKAEQGTFW